MSSQPHGKPIPVPDEASRPFFEGMKDHQLVIMRCPSGHWRMPASRRCPVCWSLEFSWERASGRGKVYTFAIMHQVLHPGFIDEAPYNVTVVELDEGPRYQANLVGIANDRIQVGMPVVATYEDVGGDVTLLRFAPV
ncbi:MAG: hypothetical protein GEU28_06840 [Dehalococcoidia bacterium]|nr:hypothetical protein [Dehalococcoidia bacterium]